MALIYNATFDKNTRKLSFEDRAGNEIYSFIVPERTPVDDITKPLTFKATQDGSTVKLTKSGSPTGDFQLSWGVGKNWVDYTIGDVIRLNIGDEVSFRTKSVRTSSQTMQDYFRFEMTGKIEAWHNVMSMYFANALATTKYVTSYAFYSLFYGCTSLTKAPVLPASGLATSCYSYMFFRCQSLTKAPELPATKLANSCYTSMFSGCQSLKEVRVSATTTATNALEEWLYGVSATGDFYCDPNSTIFPTDSASGIPKGWNRVPAVDDITKPLTFKATQDGSTVKLTKNKSPSGDFQTSRDGGNTWSDYTLDTAITLNTGDEVSFRAKADRTKDQSEWDYFYFRMTGKIEAWHNVMSLYRTNDFATYKSVVGCAFSRLFIGCNSLTKAPVLPATTLAFSCYWDMFAECQSLTEAPELPATALEGDCYYSMFKNCRSLTKAPELPATTLASRCYSSMFFGCVSLNEVRCKMPSKYSSSQISSYTQGWLSGVSSTGTFYTNADANWPSGANGIPQNWTRVNT